MWSVVEPIWCLALIVRYLAWNWRVSSILGRKVDKKEEAKSKADATCLLFVKFKWDWYQNSIKTSWLGIDYSSEVNNRTWNLTFPFLISFDPFLWLGPDQGPSKPSSQKTSARCDFGIQPEIFSPKVPINVGSWNKVDFRHWQPIASLPLLPVHCNLYYLYHSCPYMATCSIFTTPACIW